MQAVDGNAIGGLLLEVFGTEITGAATVCATCRAWPSSANPQRAAVFLGWSREILVTSKYRLGHSSESRWPLSRQFPRPGHPHPGTGRCATCPMRWSTATGHPLKCEWPERYSRESPLLTQRQGGWHGEVRGCAQRIRRRDRSAARRHMVASARALPLVKPI